MDRMLVQLRDSSLIKLLLLSYERRRDKTGLGGQFIFDKDIYDESRKNTCIVLR